MVQYAQTPLLGSLDGNEVHGALLTLAELASTFASAWPPLGDLRLEVSEDMCSRFA